MSEMLIRTNQSLLALGVPLSKTGGWALLGITIASIEGIRWRSPAKIRIGVISGLLGGLAGGLMIAYLNYLFPGSAAGRLIGLIFFGGLIGLIYSLAQKYVARGMLKILNGVHQGREYLLVQRKTVIGRSEKAHIRISAYNRVAPRHAQIQIEKGKKLIITALDTDNVLYVNDVPTEERRLKYQDVIQVGEVKMLYFYA
jgi:hypothetical protein